MPWVPTTDFEEEIVNLQPDHDFIYGALSEPEPQHSYPRPKAHIEYAHNLKKQAQKQQEQYEATGRINEKLHIIAQVQRIAGTKPLGEQATMEDWDSTKNVEKETVSMIRFCGLGPSVEQPLNQNVTIASYPVRNDIQVVKSGRKKLPLFFDDNVFKLKPKISNSSSGFESASSSSNNDDSQPNNSTDISFNTSSSSINTSSSFYTGQNDNTADDSKTSNYNKAQIERETILLNAERLTQYDKLQEETASLSLSNTSFKTANNSSSFWMPSDLYDYDNDDDDDSFDTNKTNWPALNKNDDFIPSKTWYNRKSSTNNNSFDTKQDSTDETNSNSSNQTKSSNFLDRFIKSENNNTTRTKSQTPLTNIPSTYANVTKTKTSVEGSSASRRSQGAISKSKINKPPNMPQFFTARELYERKRSVVDSSVQYLFK